MYSLGTGRRYILYCRAATVTHSSPKSCRSCRALTLDPASDTSTLDQPSTLTYTLPHKPIHNSPFRSTKPTFSRFVMKKTIRT
jgi:hypothetical protein